MLLWETWNAPERDASSCMTHIFVLQSSESFCFGDQKAISREASSFVTYDFVLQSLESVAWENAESPQHESEHIQVLFDLISWLRSIPGLAEIILVREKVGTFLIEESLQ